MKIRPRQTRNTFLHLSSSDSDFVLNPIILTLDSHYAKIANPTLDSVKNYSPSASFAARLTAIPPIRSSNRLSRGFETSVALEFWTSMDLSALSIIGQFLLTHS